MTPLLVGPPAIVEDAAGARSFFEWQCDGLTRQQYFSLPMEHLGLMSIKAYAEAEGLPVQTLNAMVAGHHDLEQTWQAMLALTEHDGPPEIVGFSDINTFEEVVWLARRCRRAWPDSKIVFGNTFATLNYERVLRTYDCFDYVVLGEGELSFLALARAVLSGGTLERVPGLARRGDGGGVCTNHMSALDLDALPWPARDELPAVLAAGFSAAVFSSRGCPYRCTFCGTGATSALMGRDTYRLKSVENVVDEIEFLVRDFGIEFLCISDDLFISKHARMQERAVSFANEILRRGIHVAFMIDARVDSVVDLGVFALLRQAGLRRVFMGIESGSYEQLVKYKKRYLRADGDAAAQIRALADLGIEVIPGAITFHPTVTPDELRETVRLVKATGYLSPRKLLDHITPYAGTPLHAEYAASGYLTKEWPVAEWRFVDPGAQQVYERMTAYLDASEGVSFEEAEAFFYDLLEDWEAATRARGA